VFSRSVTELTPDPGLAALETLTSGRVLPLLAEAVGLQPIQRRALRCDADVLSHKLGQRCTIRYKLTWPVDSSGGRNQLTLIGKLYGRPPLASRLYMRAAALRDGPFSGSGSLTVPRPLLLVNDLGFVVLEDVHGTDLRHLLAADTLRDPMSLLGEWLARLHAASPLRGLTLASPEHELAKVHRWYEYIVAESTGADGSRLTRALDTMREAAFEMTYEPVMIHKDFYYGNALWDGECVCVLDFDELSIGDPALDIGHFLAHLDASAYRTIGRVDGFSEAACAFSNAYRERASFPPEPRLTFYKAFTFLKLAATEVSRKQSGWDHMTRMLAGLAIRELERMPT